jgi:hypothetical protein
MPTPIPENGLNLLSWWGAGLSTLLAIVKLAEFWRDRFRLFVGYKFTGDSESGNEILIRNLSSHPLILGHWELLYCSGKWPRRFFDEFNCPDLESSTDTRIEPHTTLTLNFSGPDHFDWGVDALNGRRIFIRLHVVGRSPILRQVYPYKFRNLKTRFPQLN